MSPQLGYYKDLYEKDTTFHDELKQNVDGLNKKLNTLSDDISIKSKELNSIKADIKKYQAILSMLSREVLINDLGLYEPEYKYATLQEYEIALSDNRIEQKKIIKNYKKLYEHIRVSLDGRNNRQILDNYCRLIVENFNLQCERLISKVNGSNLTNIKQRVVDLYEKSNKKGELLAIKLPDLLLDLKIKELDLVFEKAFKHEKLKEERAYQATILREQERSDKQLAKEYKILSKNKSTLEVKLNKPHDESLDKEYDVIIDKIEKCNTMMSNNKAGWVYIINNPSLGKNVYKIGVTRRPDPQTRIDELNSASVPFKFGINCLLYSDNAFALESKLHQEFDKYRVNKINKHKEYFKVDLEFIEQVVKEKYDPKANFIYNNIDENFTLSGYKL